MNSWFWYVFAYLIFPGFLFTGIIGLVSTWIDRKVSAAVQWRVGPGFAQPFYDVVKLFGKETVIPANANTLTFILAPVAGLVAVTLASAILWMSNLFDSSFIGDLIVVIYLLMLPSIAVIVGGSASGNPLSAIGASREIKLILSYELPFLLCIGIVVAKSGTIELVQLSDRVAVSGLSGIIAFVVSILCVQAKLGFVPFDIPEAETELMAGPYIEYSGAPLAVFKMTQAMMFFVLPVFIVTVFLGGIHSVLSGILKIVPIWVVIILIKNTNPRVRIDQAIGFFWKYVFGFAVFGLVLAAAGRIYGIPWL
jgi:NADH-quinone oxidoreductase subunit H